MEDRRTALAIFLCILVVLAYSELVLKPVPPAEQQQTAPAASTTTQAPVGPTTSARPAEPTPDGQTGEPVATITNPTLSDLEEAGLIEIESDLFVLRLSRLGGRLVHVLLKEHHKTLEGEERLDLVMNDPNLPYPLGVYIGNQSDVGTRYELFAGQERLSRDSIRVPAEGSLQLRLEGLLPDGTPIAKTLNVESGSYLLGVGAAVANAPLGSNGVWLEWSAHLLEDQVGSSYDPVGFRYLEQNGDAETLPAVELEVDGERQLGPVRWATLGDKYFMGAILPGHSASPAIAGKKERQFYFRVRGEERSGDFRLYAGPKEYDRLKKTGYDLQRTIDMGVFAVIAHPLMRLLHLFYSVLQNYGLAIVLLTLLVKLAFLPLTSASFRSMKAMQDLQPEMKALRERIKDPTQLNQEMMKLYKKRGVNPMGGCLPMVIQIPVFFGLYMGLLNSIELRHAPFALWISDLSAPEALPILGINVPVMIILMGLSMILQQWFTPSAMDPQQKKVMMLVPVIFTVMFIIFPFPAGLVLYWLVSNVISIIQQGYLRSERDVSPFQATIIASVGIFGLSYVLTLI